MLSQYTPVATLAVKDMSRARGFYEGTLGLKPERDMPGGVSYSCGDGHLFVYESEFAGTNKATAVNFQAPLPDFDAEVAELRGAGVSFLTFELDGVSWQDGVAMMGPMKSVWFTDPDGNILNLFAGEM